MNPEHVSPGLYFDTEKIKGEHYHEKKHDLRIRSRFSSRRTL